MKVEYRTILNGEYRGFQSDKPEAVYEYEEVHRVFCCEDMTDAWDDSIIGFGKHGSTLGGNNINIIRYRGDDCYDTTPINLCPWCGERVECVEIQRARLVKKIHHQSAKDKVVYEPEPFTE